jgi:hypothetical protein
MLIHSVKQQAEQTNTKMSVSFTGTLVISRHCQRAVPLSISQSSDVLHNVVSLTSPFTGLPYVYLCNTALKSYTVAFSAFRLIASVDRDAFSKIAARICSPAVGVAVN